MKCLGASKIGINGLARLPNEVCSVNLSVAPAEYEAMRRRTQLRGRYGDVRSRIYQPVTLVQVGRSESNIIRQFRIGCTLVHPAMYGRRKSQFRVIIIGMIRFLLGLIRLEPEIIGRPEPATAGFRNQ